MTTITIKNHGQEFGGPLNLAVLCGRIVAKAGSDPDRQTDRQTDRRTSGDERRELTVQPADQLSPVATDGHERRQNLDVRA